MLKLNQEQRWWLENFRDNLEKQAQSIAPAALPTRDLAESFMSFVAVVVDTATVTDDDFEKALIGLVRSVRSDMQQRAPDHMLVGDLECLRKAFE